MSELQQNIKSNIFRTFNETQERCDKCNDSNHRLRFISSNFNELLIINLVPSTDTDPEDKILFTNLPHNLTLGRKTYELKSIIEHDMNHYYAICKYENNYYP
jgi:hypothetical protein